MLDIARLILLNGPPAVGKSSVARRYLADEPLALAIEIDDLRTRLGQWQIREESKFVARELAVALAETQLRLGYDMVVPQYLGRIDFIERLDETASRADAEFIEVLLDADQIVASERFRARRQDLRLRDTPHPESDVDEGDVDAVMADAIQRLANIRRMRPNTTIITAHAALDQTYAAFRTAINGPIR